MQEGRHSAICVGAACLGGQRPEHQRRRSIFALEAFQRARGAHRVARLEGVAQVRYIVAGDIHHRRLDLFQRELAGRVDQAQLLDFLVRRQQVAFDVGGDEFKREARRALFLPRHAFGDPLRQACQGRRIAFDGDTRVRQRRDPGRFLRLPVELGQGDQRHDARAQRRDVALQRFAAFAPGFARRNAQVDQLGAAEQRHVAGGEEEVVPLEAGAGDDHFALFESLLARGGADGVAGFDDQQRLVAVQQVERRQRFVEMGRKLFRPQQHGRTLTPSP